MISLPKQEEKKEDLGGSSYIRYEIIDKKGKQFLVPVRYSIRRAAKNGTNDDADL